MIHCGAREKTNIWRPWRQELWKRQRQIGILVNWGCFLQNYELLLDQYDNNNILLDNTDILFWHLSKSEIHLMFL